MEQKTAKCKECENEVSIWDMESDMWTCYECLDKERENE